MIVLDHVTKGYGRTVVFDDVSFALPGPGVTLVLGPNGSGKTTLVRCLLGLEPHEGTITWDGAPFRPADRCAYPVFDDVPFYPRLTGRQNLALLAPEALSVTAPYVEPHLLRRKVSAYSYGQRKRLALVAALRSTATTLLLDEPTNGLDLDTLDLLREDLRALADSGRRVIVTSHHTDFFAGLADRAVVLRQGGVHCVDVAGLTAEGIRDVYDGTRPAGRA